MLLDKGINEIETLYIDNVIVFIPTRHSLVDKIESTEEGVMKSVSPSLLVSPQPTMLL